MDKKKRIVWVETQLIMPYNLDDNNEPFYRYDCNE